MLVINCSLIILFLKLIKKLLKFEKKQKETIYNLEKENVIREIVILRGAENYIKEQDQHASEWMVTVEHIDGYIERCLIDRSLVHEFAINSKYQIERIDGYNHLLDMTEVLEEN